jgi:riboflavin biosynthesis pyrimidine reductase
MVAQFVCALHGGKTPLAQQAAREFLDGLREPALEVLYRATRNAPPCEHCGRSDADRDPVAVRAAVEILNRTGFGPHATIDTTETIAITKIERVIVEGGDTWRQHATREELATVARIIDAAKGRAVVDGALVRQDGRL